MSTPRPAQRLDPMAPAQRRSLVLPTGPSAARAARRMVREAVAGGSYPEWADPAELACTELVTNALLHAHSSITLTVEVRPEELLVEVSDGSSELPQPRSGDPEATTGRGMLLVARLVSEHGVRRDHAGKTVWFSLRAAAGGPGGGASAEDLLSVWGEEVLDGAAAGPTGEPYEGAGQEDTPRSSALLMRLPPSLWLAAEEHHQTMLRELVLYLAQRPSTVVDMVPVDAARMLLAAAVRAAVERSRLEGTARRPLPDDHPGELPDVPDHLDLELSVPTSLVPGFAALQDALDLAERLALDGRLLARPGLPEVVAVRDWACEQVVAQVGGAPPAPWPGTDHEQFLAQDDVWDPSGGWDLDMVRLSSRPVVGADDSNRIVAVSPAMAAAVGWDADDLVGRRVVTLIPARLREAHVAGFSRHLSTGHARLLGLPLVLPVLRADGSEIRCGVVIEEAAAAGHRRLYLAWFDPQPPEPVRRRSPDS